MFWNIPAEDLEEIRRVWERTKNVIIEGVQLRFDGRVTHNNLPKQAENRVAHVRPHAKDMQDTYPLPDGRSMPKQCFWLNRTYIEDVINGQNRRLKAYYDYLIQPTSNRAEERPEYGTTMNQIPFVPCGAYVKHDVFGMGQVHTIVMSLEKNSWSNTRTW